MPFHWKHGWVPVSAAAKKYVAGKGPKPGGGGNNGGLANGGRSGSYRAMSVKDSKVDAANARAEKGRAKTQAKQDQKLGSGRQSAANMQAVLQGNFSAGQSPVSKMVDRVANGKPFRYDPTTGKVSPNKGATNPTLISGTDKEIDVGYGRLGQIESKGAEGAIYDHVSTLIAENTREINAGRVEVAGRVDDTSGKMRVGLAFKPGQN